jgi:DNA-binding transcriptional ArsR family regulator
MMSATQGAFRALSDPTRRQILMHLSQSDLTIAEVSDHFDITRGAIKKHLTILEQGKLISVYSRGRERINHLEPLGMKSAADWLSYFNQFWDNKLDNLRTALNENNKLNEEEKK